MKGMEQMLQRSPDADSGSLDTHENKEALNLPPVYVAYRDNDLFASLVPKVLEDMQKIGRKVIVHSFPKGTPEDEIKKYFENEDVQKSMKDTQLFADRTCTNKIDYKFIKENLKGKYNLDSFSQKTLGASLVGKEAASDSNAIEHSVEVDAFAGVASRIIKEHGEPDTFYIVEEKIADHNFYNPFTPNNAIEVAGGYANDKDEQKKRITELLELDSEAFIAKLESNKYFSKALRFGFDKKEMETMVREILASEGMPYEEQRKKWETFVAEKIKDALNSVISEAKLKIVQGTADVPSEGNNYVLVDRHAEHPTQVASKIKLPLPFSSMVQHIKENNLLAIDSNIDESIKTELNEMFNVQKSS